MKIAIVGAGFTGLAAAWDLSRAGHKVTVYEAHDYPGGLAAGFQHKGWEWSLEHHYHHIFRSDIAIQQLVSEMGLKDLLFFQSVKTSMRYQDHQFRFDSPMSLLACPFLSFPTKFRTAATLAFLKIWPYWQVFEKYSAKTFLKKTMGEEAWRVLWEPLFVGKFGQHSHEINAAWFWSRIHVRSSELGYFRTGFLGLAKRMDEVLQAQKVSIMYKSPISSIMQNKKTKLIDVVTPTQTVSFDKVLITSPSPVFSRMVKGLPAQYVKQISNLKGLAAVTLVLELDTEFFHDKTYWLNINEANWPILAVVEHTRFAGKHPYNNKTIVYVGKYLENTDPQYSMTKDQLLQLYMPYLQKLSPHVEKHITESWVFHSPFAQPIVTIGHSKQVPSIVTPVENVYWSSLQHVYPWDRGTNYAVQLGRMAASQLMKV